MNCPNCGAMVSDTPTGWNCTVCPAAGVIPQVSAIVSGA
jgi:hypothetical protein